MKLDKQNLNSDIESKSERIQQLEKSMASSVASYEKTIDHYNDNNFKTNESLRDLRRQLEEVKLTNRKIMEDLTMTKQNMRLFRYQSMNHKTEFDNLKIKYNTLETSYNRKSLEFNEIKTSNDTDKTQKEWMEEKFRFMERDRAAEINQMENKWKEKVSELKSINNLLWMSSEDNLNFLVCKDNLIAEMTIQTKSNSK